MLRLILWLLLLAPAAALSAPWFQGEPEYLDDTSRELAAGLLDAHGGMAAMTAAKSVQFSFFTKMIGNPTPFYSFEALDLSTGDAYVDWPFGMRRSVGTSKSSGPATGLCRCPQAFLYA